MAECIDTNAADAIDIALALLIEQANTFTAHKADRQAAVSIHQCGQCHCSVSPLAGYLSEPQNAKGQRLLPEN